MTEIRFYHLENQRTETALPALITKALSNGHRILLKANDEARIKTINEFLWSHDPNSFIPHGTKKDGHTDKQPVYLTHENNDAPNNPDLLLLIDDTKEENLENYKLCCRIFDGRNPETLKAIRDNWKLLKGNESFELTYWQQGQNGWEKKG